MNKNKKTSIVSFKRKQDKAMRDEAFDAGVAEGMYFSSNYAISLLDETKYNHWWWLKNKYKDRVENDN